MIAASAFTDGARVANHQLVQWQEHVGLIGHREAVRRAVWVWHWRWLDHRSRKRARRILRETHRRYPWALGYEMSIAAPHGSGDDRQPMYDTATRTWFGTIVGTLKAAGGTAFDVSNPKYNGGGVGNGIADDTLAAQEAGTDASTKGGGIVWFPATVANVYGISGSLTFYTNVVYAMPWGTQLKWIGGDPGSKTYMIGCVAVNLAFVQQCGLFEVTLNAANVAHVYGLRVDSVRRGEFRKVYINSVQGTAGLWAVELLASVGSTPANSTWDGLWSGTAIEQCQRGFRFNGNQNGTFVTNNVFVGQTQMLCAEAWFDFQQWCDSNYFYGAAMGCTSSATGSFRGITMGDPVTDLGVHSERFNGCSVDTNTSGMSGAIGLVFNVCASCSFQTLFSGIGGVAGIVTFEQGTLFTFIQGSTGGCFVEWINQAAGTGSTRRIVFDIGQQGAYLSGPTTNVNGVGFQSADTGNPPTVTPVGTDATANLALNGKGTGGGVSLNHHRPNWITFVGGAAAGAVQMFAEGSDATIPLHVNAKGAAEVRIGAQLANFLAVFGAAAASHPQLTTEGSDSNPNLQLIPKGAGLTQAIRLSPGTDAGAVQTGQLFMGSGVPSNSNGNNGDAYHRTDTPGTANQRLYVKSAGAWTGIL